MDDFEKAGLILTEKEKKEIISMAKIMGRDYREIINLINAYPHPELQNRKIDKELILKRTALNYVSTPIDNRKERRKWIKKNKNGGML